MEKKRLRSKVMGILLITGSVLVGFILIMIIGGIITQHLVYTPPFKGADGKVLPGSIAEFRRVKLGGNSQAILIRGKSIDNPVVLFLHAGPGLSETGMMRNMNSVLEDYYTMVYLDQRGGGKSYSFFSAPKSINTAQLIQDVHELTQYLKKTLKKEKIIIMGHSFGAGFSSYAAARYPEDYSLCINIGQPVCPVECDRLSYPFLLDLAKKEGNQKAVAELEKVNGYWLFKEKNKYFPGMMVLKKWVGYYGGQVYGYKEFLPFVFKNQKSSEFTIFDWPPYLLGMMFVGDNSWEVICNADFRKQAPEYKMPFIILEGRQDINTYPPFVEEYFNMAQAPFKKMYWFEKSAHFPNLEEPELFQKIMIEEVLPMTKN